MQQKIDKITIHGVHFLRLAGSAEERARQHAQLLKKEIASGVLPFLANRNADLLRRAGRSGGRPLAGEWLGTFYDKLLIPWLGRSLSREWRNVAKIFEDEGSLTRSQFYRAAFQPDGLLALSKFAAAKHLLKDTDWNALFAAGSIACTSAVASPDITKNRKLLAARNLDYPAVGPWEENATVCFHEPRGDDANIPFVSLTSAGVHTSGATAMNAEGMVIFTHAHFGSRTARLGEPIMMIGDRIIRNARTISDAIDLAKKSRRVANWSFVVASSKSNESVILEMSPDRVEVYQRNDSPLAHSNYFRHPSLQNDETNLCGAYAADLRGRKCSVENYIKERAGLVTAEDMYSALGSPVDPFTNRVHLCGNVAAAVTTIQSSVFEPETQTFWTSVRQESPASLGPFIKINVPSFWKSVDSGEWAPPPLLANKNAGVSDHYLLAMRAFREAYKIFQMEPSDSTTTRRAFEKVNDAISYVSGDSHLLIHAGLLAFKLWEFPASAKMFTNAKAAGLSYHLQNVADLFLARCFDLDGRREPAIEIYKNDTNISDPRLRGAYRDGRSRAYEAKRVRDVQFDLQFPDCFRY